uniref:Uncharacterized protein n=1 Tax=Tetraselmis sp. GSL018 TaxID=582737 RepID=A0A061R503_9CHLO
MTSTDGSFSPQLWMQRVAEGIAEQDSISRNGTPASTASRPTSLTGRDLNAVFAETPAKSPRVYLSPFENSVGFKSSGMQSSIASSYIPPEIRSPTPVGAWDFPALPPKGYRRSWDVVLEVMRRTNN